jgi:hypothetical protein
MWHLDLRLQALAYMARQLHGPLAERMRRTMESDSEGHGRGLGGESGVSGCLGITGEWVPVPGQD